MLNAVLCNKSRAVVISVKATVVTILIALAVGLPQIFHIVGGATAGAIYMPMYAPALLAGCLLGWQWGLMVGALSPIVSFGFTSLALDAAMPALARLPYMTLEIAIFGLVAGLLSKRIYKNPVAAFPAVLAAEVAGRALYAVYNLIAGDSFNAIWTSIKTSFTGLFLQAVIVPLVVIALAKLLVKEQKEYEGGKRG